MTNFDLNKLLEFARLHEISIQINYSEGENCLEIETISPAPADRYYMKRCYDVDYFIEQWKLNLRRKLKEQND